MAVHWPQPGRQRHGHVEIRHIVAGSIAAEARLGAVLSALAKVLDEPAIVAGTAADARYRDELSGGVSAPPAAVLRPRGTSDMSAILAAFDAARLPLVVQGGRTGLSGGARVLEGETVLSLERMAMIEPVDTIASSVAAGAGAPLQAVQQAADASGLMFGVDIGARGTATVGGAIATNAGGVRVLRYGMMRTQLLGLEAVLADGTIVSSMRGLPKDNSGYDLPQLFCGSEGTLGVVTQAKLRLHPRPLTEAAAFCALPSLEAATALLGRLRQRLGPLLSAFEVIMSPLYAETVDGFGLNPPLPPGSAVHALVEMQGFAPDSDTAQFAAALEAALQDGIASDVVLAQSTREIAALWHLRDELSRFVFAAGPGIGLDLSLPLAAMPGFLAEAGQVVAEADPAARIYVFGHLGDGNLHYVAITDRPDTVSPALHHCAARHGGSISAEHGVGLAKKPYLALVRGEAELAVMRRLKTALDPHQILNRGRIFDAPLPT
jgi:FAD/FMN-containing dehydrogenase